ncbi:hypothetical protein ACFVU2_19545 [Leifsonia sp. NPDC058194]|uniref:hypothetical protein n=1 Tax=Leifsonia sp. NPDC058194 TaxID=3346374 RepID=UPI0036DE96D0
MTPAPTPNFQQLKSEVTAASRARNWLYAVREWEVVGLEEDTSGSSNCICGQPNLQKLFTIRNPLTDRELYPIGSTCINHFGRRELDDEVKVLEDLAKLRRAILDRRRIAVDSEFFTRALLKRLYDDGAFPGDEYNRGHGSVDYEFLLGYFNARDKPAISSQQHRRATAILLSKIVPFVKGHPSIS